jgi:hypothetical protein
MTDEWHAGRQPLATSGHRVDEGLRAILVASG